MRVSSFYLSDRQNKKIFKHSNKYISLYIYFSIAIFLIFAKSNFSVMSNVTYTYIYIIIPSLFPFILFNNILIDSKYYLYISSSKLAYILSKIFKTNIYGACAIIIGFTMGYPNAARYLNEMYVNNHISLSESRRLMLFVNNPSPVYLISAIGIGMFNNIYIGIVLIISCILSSLLISIISYLLNKSEIENKLQIKNISLTSNLSTYHSPAINFNTITQSISNTFISLAYIFGFMVIFSILFSIIYSIFKMDKNVLSSFLNSIFEVSMRNKINI